MSRIRKHLAEKLAVIGKEPTETDVVRFAWQCADRELSRKQKP
jgi:hypothetical protein